MRLIRLLGSKLRQNGKDDEKGAIESGQELWRYYRRHAVWQREGQN
jgi:hypothetical protein